MPRPQIDIHRDRVAREGVDEPLHFMGLPDLQPEEDGVVHAWLARNPRGPMEKTLTRCRLVDGTWIHQGPAPDMRDQSWHPDLSETLGGFVVITRRVLRSIGGPGIPVADIHLDTTGSAESGYSLHSEATFSRTGMEDQGSIPRIVPEHVLNALPYVRLVERVGALHAASFFDVDAREDGPGYDGDLAFRIGPDEMTLQYRDYDEQGITLRSALVDGEWRHTTTIDLRNVSNDVVETMRAVGNPMRFLDGNDGAVAAVIGSGDDRRIEIAEAEIKEIEESGMTAIVLHVVPGTLRKRISW
jgi:hypothetical protein